MHNKANEQHFKETYEAANFVAVYKVGSIHQVETAIFAAQHPVQQAKVQKQTRSSASASLTVKYSDEGSSCN